jgi:hypothetical protein
MPVALDAALAGNFPRTAGPASSFLLITGDTLITGAFIIAITAFLFFRKTAFSEPDLMRSLERDLAECGFFLSFLAPA